MKDNTKKACTKCGTEKHLDSFPWTGSRTARRKHAWCKLCFNKNHRDRHRAANPRNGEVGHDLEAGDVNKLLSW